MAKCGDYGIRVGELPSGQLDSIGDVAGVSVGHATVDSGESHTGLTVVVPCAANPFIHKVEAGAWVLNGFGKTLGLVQLEELGTIETPIALTNTLNTWLVADALAGAMIDRCAGEGLEVSSINPVVCECNDSYLSRIQDRVLGRAELDAALASASPRFAEGAVGAGRGMSCHGLKGGIGSASRIITIEGENFTLGVLVLSNYGRLRDLRVGGRLVGPAIAAAIESRSREAARDMPDRGSIISILATDLPLCSRQLTRVAKRLSVGLARLGSYIGHGSGEIMIAFSTAGISDAASGASPAGASAASSAARAAAPKAAPAFRALRLLDDSRLDAAFRAAAECEEESVLNSMLAAGPLSGFRGHRRESLRDYVGPIGGVPRAEL